MRFLHFTSAIVLALSLQGMVPSQGQDEARLLRFPAIYDNQVVFSYGGDLYTVQATGGTARLLTTHIGYESFPRFSPDGKTIAFTGQYDGNTEVFIMPSEGGVPVRLTYTATLGRDDMGDRMGPNNIVMGWTPDGKNIIYRSRKQSFNDFKGQLFKVSAEGGLSGELPFSVGGFNCYSPDGTKLAYNRVFREFRTWKYYEGGMADEIWIFDFKTGKTENITDNPHQDIIPMWYGSTIFFLSDRDRVMNLFAYDIKTGTTKKVTDFKDYDIKFPSLGNQSVVFEKGGYLWQYVIATGEVKKIPVRILNDSNYNRNELMDVSGQVRDVALSPNGERLVTSAHGEIFNVPVKEGITVNLTKTSGIHERNAAWSPDGKQIAVLSDRSGDFEVWLMDPKGEKEDFQVTKKADTYIFNFLLSPDSKKIVYFDQKFQLWLIDADGSHKTLIDKSKFSPIGSFDWSPDSKWIAYEQQEKAFSKVCLYSVEKGEKYEVTDEWYDSGSPCFSRDGKYLIFVSARTFNPVYSSTEFNTAYRDMNKLYLVPLDKKVPSPLALKNDEVVISDTAGKAKKEDKKDSVSIDPGTLHGRIVELPVPAGNYYNIEGINNRIYYQFNSSTSQGSQFKYFDLEKKKETDLGSGLSYKLSPNGKKMLVAQGNKYSVIDIPSGKVTLDETINLKGMTVMVDKQAEWQQIYDESWRRYRDFFYDPGMHGVNWEGIRDKYKPLVSFVRHRSDLTYIIGEMQGELNVGHAYINNGPRPMPERIGLGLLGARLEKDKSGYFRFGKILDAANWKTSERSPLTSNGADVREGEYLIAINGESVKGLTDPYQLLVGKADQIVELTVSASADAAQARKVLIKPVADESPLYYYNWVQDNIRKVSEATNGEVGYIHIPDMSSYGLNEFVEHYYPQLTKKALIIDDRGNGGGNVSPMIIERLEREITYANMSRNQAEGSVNPGGTLTGPKVMLIDRYSASDGDLFPYRFKQKQMGKIIGVRTWGGVVGYSGAIPCIDGGSSIIPAFAPYAADGSGFVIEGYGVDPDIVVDNDPYEEYKGIDRQLDKAIEVIREELKTFTKVVPPIPPFPKKNK